MNDNLQAVFPTLVKANKHFDPATCPFEVHGFFEDWVDADTLKPMGSRMLPCIEAPGPLGSTGIKKWTLTEPVTLTKGFKTVTVKASRKKPRRVMTMTMILCGKQKHKTPIGCHADGTERSK